MLQGEGPGHSCRQWGRGRQGPSVCTGGWDWWGSVAGGGASPQAESSSVTEGPLGQAQVWQTGRWGDADGYQGPVLMVGTLRPPCQPPAIPAAGPLSPQTKAEPVLGGRGQGAACLRAWEIGGRWGQAGYGVDAAPHSQPRTRLHGAGGLAVWPQRGVCSCAQPAWLGRGRGAEYF